MPVHDESQLRSSDLVSLTMFTNTSNISARAFLTAVAKFNIVFGSCVEPFLLMVLFLRALHTVTFVCVAEGRKTEALCVTHFPRALFEMSSVGTANLHPSLA